MYNSVDGLIYLNFISRIEGDLDSDSQVGNWRQPFQLSLSLPALTSVFNPMNCMKNILVNEIFRIPLLLLKGFDLLTFLQFVNGWFSYQFSNVFLKRLIRRDFCLCRGVPYETRGNFLGFLYRSTDALPRSSGA